jgi:cbb3-type cytochrome oxidase subunit 3
MSPELASLFRQAWLVVCVLLFLGVIWWLLRPGAKQRAQRDAEIPLRDKDGIDG